MRKLLLFFALLTTSMMASAQGLSRGYYRVMNKKTERFVYVYDNTGRVDIATTSAEMGAMQLWKDHERTISDPASVIYVDPQSDGTYDLKSQGTSVHQIINYYVRLYPKDGAWQLYVTYAGLTKYLADEETTDIARGQLGTTNTKDYRQWVASPIDTEQNFFGLNPTIQSNGKYYKPFYADFGISMASSGMKAKYVSEVYKHIAVLKDVDSEIIAGRMPIIVECSSNNPSANKLNLHDKEGAVLNGNLMKGVYFNNDRRPKSKDARTKVDPTTMRVLGLLQDGSLGFIVPTEEYLSANESYLVVPAGTPQELVLMTETELAEFKAAEEEAASMTHVKVNAKVKGVYSLTGLKVAESMHDGLSKGVYIVDGKKVTIK